MDESDVTLPVPKPSVPTSADDRVTPDQAAELLAAGGAGLFDTRPSTASRSWQPPAVEVLQKLLPQYEISAFVARGGMGAVYRGMQRALRRAVAIKVMPPEVEDGVGDMQFAARFKQEAQAMAQLSHPNIVAVFDAGEVAAPGGMLLYFVMEFVEGTDVAQLIASEGRLEPARAVPIITAVCEALAFAHEEGIIHRDIKPSNVMIDRRGRVKVADFGLAKTINAESTLITRSDMAMGTPDFLAPETLSPGTKVDGRADIYAVGVMLYQMLTGQIPRGRFALPSALLPQVSRGFDDIVDKAMQTDRDKRYSTATHMRQDVEKVATAGLPATATASAPAAPPADAPQKPRTSAKLFITTLGALVALGALGALAGGWLLLHNPAAPSAGSKPAAEAAAEPKAIRMWSTPQDLPKQTGVTWEGDAIRLEGASLRQSMPKVRDVTFRASVRMGPDVHLSQLHVRTQYWRTDGARETSAQLNFSGDLRSIVFVTRVAGQRKVSTSWPAPRSFAEGEWVPLEIKAVKDQYTISVGGQVVGTYQDTSIMEAGGVQIMNQKAGYFKDVVMIPHDAPQGASVIADDPTIHWTDHLATRQWETPWQLKDGTLTITDRSKAMIGGMPTLADGAVRVRARARPGVDSSTSHLQMVVRGSGHVRGKPGFTGTYQFQLHGGWMNHSLLYLERDKGERATETTDTLWHKLPLPEVLRDQMDVMWELRAVGNEISVWGNGQLVRSIQDDRLSAGFATVYSDTGLEITRLETADLSGKADADRERERRAAERVLGKGYSVLVQTAAGKSLKVATAAALPAGDFSVLELENQTPNNLDDADMAALAGLPRLQKIKLYQTQVTGQGLQVLATLPALAYVTLDWNKQLKDEDLQVLQKCRQLRGLTFRHPEQLTSAALRYLPTVPSLVKLELVDFPLREEDIPLVLQRTSLQFLDLSGTPLSAAALEALHQLPDLTELRFVLPSDGRRVDFSRFPQLKRAGVTNGITTDIVKDLAAGGQLEQLVIHVPGKLTQKGLEEDVIREIAWSLKGLNTLSLGLDYPLSGSAQLSPLAALPNLKTLSVAFHGAVNTFDDAALLSLEKVGSLRTINLSATQHRVTREGLAEFQKRRPDVKIEGPGAAGASVPVPTTTATSVPTIAAHPDTAKAFPPGQWTRVWQKPEDIPNVDPGKISEGWAQTAEDNIKTAIPGLMAWNGGLRARFRYHASEPHAQLRLRDRDGKGWNVIIGFDAIHFRTHDLSKSPDYQNQGKYPATLPKEGEEYQLELVAVGRTLFGKLNGRSFSFDMGEKTGPAQHGGMYLLQTHFNPFRDVEVLNLDGLSEADALKQVSAKR